jgi:hypothetical protein
MQIGQKDPHNISLDLTPWVLFWFGGGTSVGFASRW